MVLAISSRKAPSCSVGSVDKLSTSWFFHYNRGFRLLGWNSPSSLGKLTDLLLSISSSSGGRKTIGARELPAITRRDIREEILISISPTRNSANITIFTSLQFSSSSESPDIKATSSCGSPPSMMRVNANLLWDYRRRTIHVHLVLPFTGRRHVRVRFLWWHSSIT